MYHQPRGPCSQYNRRGCVKWQLRLPRKRLSLATVGILPSKTHQGNLKPADIDGIATAGETPVTVAHYLGLTPKWVDGTAVGGCSFMIHVRHAAAAIASGLCETVLITHGESGRSGVGRTRNVVAPTSLAGQFEQPYGPMGPPTLFTIPGRCAT